MDNRLLQRLNRIKDLNEVVGLAWVFRFQPIESILQNGPQCGIVALGMALKKLGINSSVEELMQKARDLNFTKSGEIFDADYLFSLAKQNYEQARLDQLQDEHDESRLFESLMNNRLVIIAYDCDFNFEPAFKQGKKAHWALLSGILAPIDSTLICDDQTEPSLLDLDTISNSTIFERLKNDFKENRLINGQSPFREKVYCIGKQGKSSQFGVWNLSELIRSNRQLSSIDDDKLEDEMFVKPADRDLKKTLAGRYLVF